MEMAGKHSDHYFRRWQAKIVTTIYLFFEKNEKNEKFLELPDLARKLIPQPGHVRQKNSARVDGGTSGPSSVRRRGARTPIGASGNFC
jgi:hypothetical protein